LSGIEFRCSLGSLQVAPGGRDGPGVLIVRPEALRLGNPAPATSEQPNTLPVKVIDVRYRGTHQSVRLRCSAEVALTATAAASLRLEVGEKLVLRLPPGLLPSVPAVTGPASEHAEASAAQSPARTGRR